MKALNLIFTLLLCLLITEATGQTGINYQAVARDGSGVLISNSNITVKFSILSGSAGSLLIYSETHSSSTNGYGVFNLSIGNGTSTFGNFSNIDWGADEHHLKVELSTGSGFVDMGIFPFEQVPYAKVATDMSLKDIKDVDISGVSPGNVLQYDGNVWKPGVGGATGYWQKIGGHLYNVNDSIGIGISQPEARLHVKKDEDVLFGHKNEFKLWWISSKGALRAGRSDNAGWAQDSIGLRSVAFGYNTRATGSNSTAFGDETGAYGVSSTAMGNLSIASGDYSVAMGMNTNASGNFSTTMGFNTKASSGYATAIGSATNASGAIATAMGFNTTASGYNTTSMGHSTTALSAFETVMGRFNTSYTPNSTTLWNSFDRLFTIGNGSSASNRSDALVVLKNGNIGLGISNPVYNLDIKGDSIRIDLRALSDLLFVDNGFDVRLISSSGSTNGVIGSSSRPFYNIYSYEFYALNTGNYKTYSDQSIKENIQPLMGALEKILSINGFSYDMKPEYFYKGEADHSRLKEKDRKDQIGFIAQEIEKVFPQLVKKDEESGLKTVGYMGMIPVLVEAIKEQQVQIEELQKEVELLKLQQKQKE